MENKKFLTAQDVAAFLGVSLSMAYRIIRQLNNELKNAGYITVSGKINRRYFEEKVGYETA